MLIDPAYLQAIADAGNVHTWHMVYENPDFITYIDVWHRDAIILNPHHTEYIEPEG